MIGFEGMTAADVVEALAEDPSVLDVWKERAAASHPAVAAGAAAEPGQQSWTGPRDPAQVAFNGFMVGGFMAAAIAEALKGGFSRETFLRQADRTWTEALVATGAMRLGCNLPDVLSLVADAWRALAAKRVAAAAAAGRTAETRRGPTRQKGKAR